MNRDEERDRETIDFGIFDLERDPEKYERLVGNVMWRARGELGRRARTQNMTIAEAVVAWLRPALVAAAAVAGISLTMLATAGGSESDTEAAVYLSNAGVPSTMTAWYEEDRSPTASDLMVATSGDE